MSTKDITKMAREIKELTRMKEELETEISTLQDSIKTEMTSLGVEELTTAEYKIRWTNVTSNRFDTTAFKQRYKELYAMFVKQTHTKRFSIV